MKFIVMRKIYFWLYILYLSALWMRQVNLGNSVEYKGKVYIVLNGASQNHWRIIDSDGRDMWVPRDECSKVKSLSNYIHSFRFGYSFYMTSWYSIWVREGIKPWMKNCSIWPRKEGE